MSQNATNKKSNWQDAYEYMAKIQAIKGGGEADDKPDIKKLESRADELKYVAPLENAGIKKALGQYNTKYGFCTENELARAWYYDKHLPDGELKKQVKTIMEDTSLYPGEKTEKINALINKKNDTKINKDLKEIDSVFGNTPVVSHKGAKAPVGLIASCDAKNKEAKNKQLKERQDELKKLIAKNNHSGLPDEMILCQMYKESDFDPTCGAKTKAKGLMQVQPNAAKDAYYQKEKTEFNNKKAQRLKAPGLSKAEKEAIEKETFSEAQKEAAYKKGMEAYQKSVFDPETNIMLGTWYMAYCMERAKNDEREAYNIYRGRGEEPAYYDKIKKCANGLSAKPGSTQPLKDMKGDKF